MQFNCHRCGTLISEEARFCSHCGVRVGGSAGGPSLLKVLGAVCLGIICLPLGLLGGCLLMISPFSLGIGGASLIGLIAVVLLSLTVLGINQMVRLLK